MSIDSVNVVAPRVDRAQEKAGQKQASGLWKTGDIIEGLVTEVTDKVTIQFNETKLVFDENSISSAKKGDIKNFKVLEATKNRVRLQEVTPQQNGVTNQIISTKMDGTYAVFSKALDSKEQKENKSLDETASNMTASDSGDLDSTGYDYRKFELERLEKALIRIKEQRSARQQGIEKQVENQKQFEKDVKEIAKGVLNDSPYKDQIIEQLEKSDLPITEAMIEKLVKGLDMALMGMQRNNAANQYIMKNQLDLTVGSLYRSVFSGMGGNNTIISDNEYKQIEDQVNTIIKESNLPVNDKTKDMSKWIISNELPLTKESLLKLHQLDALSTRSIGSIIESIIDGISKGEKVEDITLINSNEEFNKVSKDFAAITDQTISNVCKNYNTDDITLALLKLEQAKQESTKSATIDYTNNREVTIKRQLQEICLKMTADAANKMAAKGISVETDSLQRIVHELRAMEKEYYSNLLTDNKLDNTKENVATLGTTAEYTSALKSMPMSTLSATFSIRDEVSLNTLHDTCATLKVRYESANSSYESFMTRPRTDLGDSIKSAFTNSMQDILHAYGLEDTDVNRRAIRMLGYSSMEITKESIEEMKLYDEKVNYTLKNLSPEVTMEIIRNNKNPLMIPLNELNMEIAKIKESKGFTEEEGYARYLRKLERQSGITEEERQSYIGIYRLLHNVTVTDGAAISSLIKNEKELTLNNLLSEVRTKKIGHIDEEIDNRFGELQQIKYKTTSITDQINKAFTEDNQKDEKVSATYNKMLLKDIMDEISPISLREVLSNEDFSNLTLEKLRDGIRESKGNTLQEQEYNEQEVEKVRELANHSEQAVDFLVRCNEPVTIRSIQQAQLIMESANALYLPIKNIYKQQNETKESLAKEEHTVEDNSKDMDVLLDNISTFETKKELQNAIHSFSNIADSVMNQEIENPEIKAKDVEQINIVKGAIRLANKLAQKEHYEIPVSIKGEVMNISLTVVNKNSLNQSSIQMSVNSNTLGNVRASISFKDSKAKAFVVTESKEICSQLKENKDALIKELEKKDIQVLAVDYGVTTHSQSLLRSGQYSMQDRNEQEDAQSKLTTKQLYEVAKTFVSHIKSLDNME